MLGFANRMHQLMDAVQAFLRHLRHHVCGQVEVIVIERGDDIELDFDDDTLSKVVYRSILNQQL